MSADNQEIEINQHLSGEIDELQRRIRVREISDIRKFFSEDARPLEEREFIVFWQSLSDAEKEEFKRADLS